MTDAIATFGLTKYYGHRLAVDSLDLHIKPGTVYGLLGRNGAGKSTTIKMLLGMSHPTRGRATLLGEDAQNLRPETRARIAYLAEGHPLYRWMTIGQAVRFTRAFYERYRWNQPLLDQILDHFELSPKRKIRRLSRGQQAQVALALAVASDPELLILDDPTLGLDTVVRRDFLESLIQIIQRRGRTILFSSHILNDVERVADRIGIMIDGVLRVDCPTDHFKESLRKISWEAPAASAIDFTAVRSEIEKCPGVINSRRVGQRVEIVVVGYGDAHRQLFESLGAKDLDVMDFNLEDAFIEYTRGPRRSLPIFATEENEEAKQDTKEAAYV